MEDFEYNEVESDRSVWKGAVAGVVGGLVASWVMNQFQAGLSRVSGQPQQNAEDGENATEKAAAAVAEPLLDRSLTRQEKQTAGPAVHYAFGSTVGAIYGAVAEMAPATTTAWGLPFGT